ncbi:hypothetical protein C8Q70DRAFT_679297 [Cubamyces menziesii]|nr:hypothetical protein C8Q70DRAFT_679297 [Cubamyces menziesii]
MCSGEARPLDVVMCDASTRQGSFFTMMQGYFCRRARTPPIRVLPRPRGIHSSGQSMQSFAEYASAMLGHRPRRPVPDSACWKRNRYTHNRPLSMRSYQSRPYRFEEIAPVMSPDPVRPIPARRSGANVCNEFFARSCMSVRVHSPRTADSDLDVLHECCSA